MRNKTGASAAIIALLLATACQRGASDAENRSNGAQDNGPTEAAMNVPIDLAPPSPSNNAVAAAIPAPSDDMSSQFEIANLAGRWRVVGVAPGEGVGAYVKDDPAYLGQVLEVSAERLAWATPKASHATLDDRCEGPVTQHLTGKAGAKYADDYRARIAALGPAGSDPHGVECDGGNWGPEAAGGTTLWRSKDGGLLMSWYDGLLLKLARDR